MTLKLNVTELIFQMYSSLTQSMKPMKRSIVLSGRRFWMKAVVVQKVAQVQKKKMTQKRKVKMVSSTLLVII
jgi:hypothetical protein